MNDKVTDFIINVSELWSEVSPINDVISNFKTTTKTINLYDVLTEINELLPYIDSKEVPDYAIRLLDSLNLQPNPDYGFEPATAVVYFNKALFYKAKGDTNNTLYCLQVVEGIPEWKVIYGKRTLLEIKAEAKKLKLEITNINDMI